jgi:ribonuclease Z
MGLITLLRNNLRAAWLAKPSRTGKNEDDDDEIASDDDQSKPGNAFSRPRSTPPSTTLQGVEPSVEIYGPAGLRAFVRQILTITNTRSADKYAVHELLTASDPVTPCNPCPSESESDDGAPAKLASASPDVMHASELPGRDIRCGADGFWRAITVGRGSWSGAEVRVDAGPIVHRDPCVGYVFREMGAPARKLVILGDTQDADAIVPLIKEDVERSHPRAGASVTTVPQHIRFEEQMEPDKADEDVSGALSNSQSVSLLVHEATDAYIPPSVDPMVNRKMQNGHLRLSPIFSDHGAPTGSPELVDEKCVERGHSTPIMAGEFARKIGAQRVVLNHIGSR